MHKIAIPESVVAGAMQQRGKLNRYDTIVGPQTALVVIDLQNVFMQPGAAVEVPTAREIVPDVNRLAAAMRAAGGKVVWVQMTLNDQEQGWSVFFEGDRRREAFKQMQRGSHGHALYDTLDVKADDLIVEKRRYSAFIQGASNIDQILRGFGIDTVVITGTLTNVCCESSARDAMMLNYKVVFVSDANAALSDAEHNATLGTILRVFGDVATTDETIARLVPAQRFSIAAVGK
ncbi:MAG TPA: cysteine hydrolase [Stellaceae bacterium]|jgi:ureidoacrylate peracid hydrolase|nr:cysteine hydrolase [Stellaceae bacterium]